MRQIRLVTDAPQWNVMLHEAALPSHAEAIVRLRGVVGARSRATEAQALRTQGVLKRYDHDDRAVCLRKAWYWVEPHSVTRSRPSSSKRARTVQK